MYIIRLDDASNYMNHDNWNKMELLLEKYNIKPIVGIIPNNKDKDLLKYKKDDSFWNKAIKWQDKGWTIAMHGYEHVYCTNDGGINPVQKRSEFAGNDLKTQENKIGRGFSVLKEKGLIPKVFFAPSHTFDENTLIAIKNKTDIRIISDTIANDVYYKDDLFFIPQQSGIARNLPFRIVTFCYHPNEMKNEDFVNLERFIIKNKDKFIDLSDVVLKKRKLNIYDKILTAKHIFNTKGV